MGKPKPTEKIVRDIFVSHRSTNKDVVSPLVAAVEAEIYLGRNLLCWYDEAEIRPGESIVAAVNSGLECSRFFGIALTPEYFEQGSGWTDAEWHAAIFSDPDNRGAKVIPLLLADCPYVPALLRHLRMIDFRGAKFQNGLADLLGVLREEPLKRPTMFRGQLITSSGLIDRKTLLAEQAVPQAYPEEVREEIFCNLLPVIKLPTYIYTGAIAPDLCSKEGEEVFLPSKQDLKSAIRETQQSAGEPAYMPAFRLFEDRIISFHDLTAPDSPLQSVIDEHDVVEMRTEELLEGDDDRNIVTSLLNMAIGRHIYKAGLVSDDDKKDRYYFPPEHGGDRVVSWKPAKKLAKRTVAKACRNREDGTVSFWRHQGAYLTLLFLANKFYLQIEPTWVITEDGVTLMKGPNVTKLANKWTNPERNLQILYHVRFWSKTLQTGGGPISIRAGDQWLEISAVPAYIEQSHGIAGDRKDLLMELDEAADLIAAQEDQQLDANDSDSDSVDDLDLSEDEF